MLNYLTGPTPDVSPPAVSCHTFRMLFPTLFSDLRTHSIELLSIIYSHIVVTFLPKFQTIFAAADRHLFYRFSNPYNENLLQVTFTYSRTPDAGSPHESDHSMY